MKKYFIVSDIHSFYTPLIEALNNSGFDKDNQDHILVVLGDVFDRGNETLEVYEFLKSIPDDRLILIKGNHELLYEEVLETSWPDDGDFKNGTIRTFCDIANVEQPLVDSTYWHIHNIIESMMPNGDVVDIDEQVKHYWNIIINRVSKSEVTKWIKSKKWINYLETDKYIFVHSWIPCSLQLTRNGGKYSFEEIGPREDWRNATQTEWNDATWGCPWSKAKAGWNITGKTIVCGHWSTSDFFNNLTKQKKKEYDCPIFKSKRYKLIGLDACTVMSGKVNVLVLNEDEL